MTEFGEWHEARILGEIVGIDFMGPFPRRKVVKKHFVLVIVDRLTGFSEAQAFRGVGSRKVITGLDHWVRLGNVLGCYVQTWPKQPDRVN